MEILLHVADSLIAGIKHHPNWILVAFFVSAIISGIPVLGSIVPASVFQLALSSAAAKLGLNPLYVVIFMIPGLLAGDFTGYLCGHYFNTGIKHWAFFKKRQALFEKCESTFERYGGIAIVMGRVAGPLRTITPIASGILEMSCARFLFFDFLAACLWCITHLGTGYLAMSPGLWHKLPALFG